MFDLNWREQVLHWGTGASLGDVVGEGVGEEGKMEEVEFFKVEVVDLKEVPGEEDMEEAGEEECKEEGGFGAA